MQVIQILPYTTMSVLGILCLFIALEMLFFSCGANAGSFGFYSKYHLSSDNGDSITSAFLESVAVRVSYRTVNSIFCMFPCYNMALKARGQLFFAARQAQDFPAIYAAAWMARMASLMALSRLFVTALKYPSTLSCSSTYIPCRLCLTCAQRR